MKNFNISAFEAISESSENQLVGGFSASFSIKQINVDSMASANNCRGGNCTSGCGSGQNTGTCQNTVAGCGKSLEAVELDSF